jgi:hypothetical protein
MLLFSGRIAVACTLLFLICGRPSEARPPCGPDTTITGDWDVTSSVPCRRARSKLLEFVASVAVPGAESFAAAAHFRLNQTPSGVPIVWLGANFRRRFLRKVEFNIAGGELDIFRLRKSARDPMILSELGGYPEVLLHDIWILLGRQSRGQRGPLRINATPNVFYVRDFVGRIWAVDVVWGGAGWEIGASSLGAPPWRHGRQIIAR